MRKAFVLLLFTGLIWGCEAPIKDQIMDVHDEVMPLMDPLYQTRKQLQDKADSLDPTSAAYGQHGELIRKIEVAEAEMMNWMRNYEPNFEGQTDSVTTYYYEAQKAAIEEVASQMNAALEEGKSMLEP